MSIEQNCGVLVSIGLPVFNGGSYLREALDSLITQRYENIEIIISDNASNDDTARICAEYEARDNRVRYYRSEVNLGAAWNFNNVLKLARGEFFMWAAFDDRRHPRFICRCLEELLNNPDAVMCCSQIQFIDEDGNPLDIDPENDWRRPTGRTRSERIGNLARMSAWYDLYGLIRKEYLLKTSGFRTVWGGDVILIAELCLLGPIISVPEKLFYYRVFGAKKLTDMGETLAPKTVPAISVSFSNKTIGIAKSILKCDAGLIERMRVATGFVLYFLLFNLITRNLVRQDIWASMLLAWHKRYYRRVVALIPVGALVAIPVPLCRLPGKALRVLRRLNAKDLKL